MKLFSQRSVVLALLAALVALPPGLFGQVFSAYDVAANYTGGSFAGNQGFGFGNWTVSGGGYLTSDSPASFGLSNRVANSLVSATRPFASGLAVGQSFGVQLMMNSLDTAVNTNGFRLLDASGNVLFTYWHQGGDNANAHYTDAQTTNGTATGFAFDYGLMDAFLFTLTSATNYSFSDQATGVTFSGRLAGTNIAQVQFFRANGTGTPSNGQDFKFNALVIPPVQSVNAYDVASNYVAAGWSGNQGFGFGSWTLNAGSGGAYISGDTPPCFGLWNSSANAVSSAMRSLAGGLNPGQTLSLQLEMTTLDTALQTNGFQLQDAFGKVLFSYWHQGGDGADGHYSDGVTTNGTAIGFAFDYLQLDRLTFTLTSPTNYLFTDWATGQSFTGRLAGTGIRQITLFRANGNAAPSNGQDLKFNGLQITGGNGLAYEGFAYPPGGVASQTGGVGWGGAWTNVTGNAMYFDEGNLTAFANAPAGLDGYSQGGHLSGYGGSRVGRLLDCNNRGLFARNGLLNGAGVIGAPGRV
ncbi:MAG TPA: hypothetical protein VF607_17270, partial [Verrucomicrobiae bacterium]